MFLVLNSLTNVSCPLGRQACQQRLASQYLWIAGIRPVFPYKTFLACVGLFVLLAVTPSHGWKSASTHLKEIINHYDAIETQSIDLVQWKTHTNDQGSVSWNTSYLLSSYVDMYEVTSNRKYLDKFVELANPLVDGTDANRGLADYKGRKRIGWGSVAYSEKGQRVIWLVHTGMITYPLLRFAYVVIRNHKVRDLLTTARKYQSVSESALGEFDGQWRYDPKDAEGFYLFESDQPLDNGVAGPDLPQPLNMQLAAGRSFLILAKITSNQDYLQKAHGLAKLLRSRLVREGSGGYSWTYWFGKGLSRSSVLEDVSHGAIDVEFAVLAEQNSIVFTPDDLKPFVATFLDRWGRAQSSMATGVGKGTAEFKAGERNALDRWAPLSEVSCRVYDVLYADLMARIGRQDAQVLLGIAQLATYARKCAAASLLAKRSVSPYLRLAQTNGFKVLGEASAVGRPLRSRQATGIRSHLAILHPFFC